MTQNTAIRNTAFDNLRIFLTLLVIFHHTAISYGAMGSWYWREEPNGSTMPLVLFNAINQSYFMGFFFLLAGYYAYQSLARKDAKLFLRDRFLRLGIPLVFYFLILSPLTIALASNDPGSLWDRYVAMLRAEVFEPGPLWFAEALLIFSLVYGLSQRQQRLHTALPSFTYLLGAVGVLGLISFVVRLAVPVGEDVLWLQLGYFPCYIFLFAAGSAAAPSQLLEKVSARYARPWIIISIVTFLTTPIVIEHKLGPGEFEGGLSFNALYYSFWDPLVGFGIILGLLCWAQHSWNKANRITDFLARRAFAIFIIHPPIVVAVCRMLADWDQEPLVKFAIAGTLSALACIVVSSLLLYIPPVRRIV